MIRQLPRRPRQFFDLFEEYGSGSIARLPKHRNGGLELHYIARGHLHWEIEGRPFLVPPKSVFFTFPWEKHGSSADFEPGHFFHFVVFRMRQPEELNPAKIRLAPGFGLSHAEESEIFFKLLSVRNRCFVASPDFAWVMARLTKELTEPGALARTNIIALSRAVLCELVKNARSTESRNHKNHSSEPRVIQFANELRTRCAEPWTLDSMAAACRLKRTQFEILTKELTGDTPSRLLNRFRVRLSQQPLRSGHRTITEIAFNSGFSSSQYFSRIFKNIIGITPSQYRQRRGNLAVYDRRFLQVLTQLKSSRNGFKLANGKD
ncbi:MAG TPA: AraC family transcriptional regulator [Pseudomonadales bacterium]|nr:AraC family transcriptional regulator [Pseudomonadales bacterium]